MADVVQPSIHVVKTAAKAIRDAGLANGRLALVGASYMTAAAYLGLVEELPDGERATGGLIGVSPVRLAPCLEDGVSPSRKVPAKRGELLTLGSGHVHNVSS